MASSSTTTQLLFCKLHHVLAFLCLLALSSSAAAEKGKLLGCYTTMFNFGDSATDTGNILYVWRDRPTNIRKLPYGETFFHRPTGRCTDGRVILDFFAEAFGIPFLPPYLPANASGGHDLSRGANFALAGAIVLNSTVYRELGLRGRDIYITLADEVEWFKQLLPSICHGYSECQRALSRTLFMISIQGNDYSAAFWENWTVAETSLLIPPMVKSTGSAVKELIGLGATNVMVASQLPAGCTPYYLTLSGNPNGDEIDRETGCLKWPNEFAKSYNRELQEELNRLRDMYPHTTNIYADLYNACLLVFRSPHRFGFSKSPFMACCGSGGGQYNYNIRDLCENGEVKTCSNPSSYVSWDGIHYTEHAYAIIAKGLLDGTHTSPPISTTCGPHLAAGNNNFVTANIAGH